MEQVEIIDTFGTYQPPPGRPPHSRTTTLISRAAIDKSAAKGKEADGQEDKRAGSMMSSHLTGRDMQPNDRPPLDDPLSHGHPSPVKTATRRLRLANSTTRTKGLMKKKPSTRKWRLRKGTPRRG